MKLKPEEMSLGNGAGVCKRLDEAEELLGTALTDVTIGSISLKRQDGNPGNNFSADNEWICGINRLNLPNPGMEYWEEHSPDFLRKARDKDKRARISIVADDPRTLADLAYRAFASGWEEVEVDGSCPNRTISGKKRPILCFDPELMEMTLDKLWLRIMPKQFYFKLAPYSNPVEKEWALRFALGHPGVCGLVLCNTFPETYNLRLVEGKFKTLIDAERGFGGMSGRALMPISLAHVNIAHTIREESRVDKKIIGAGGIWDGKSFLKYLAAGADGGQMTTRILERGKNSARKAVQEVADDIVKEMLTLVQ